MTSYIIASSNIRAEKYAGAYIRMRMAFACSYVCFAEVNSKVTDQETSKWLSNEELVYHCSRAYKYTVSD